MAAVIICLYVALGLILAIDLLPLPRSRSYWPAHESADLQLLRSSCRKFP